MQFNQISKNETILDEFIYWNTSSKNNEYSIKFVLGNYVLKITRLLLLIILSY